MPCSKTDRRILLLMIGLFAPLLLISLPLSSATSRTMPQPARAASHPTHALGNILTNTVYIPMIKSPRLPVGLQNDGFEGDGCRETFTGQPYAEIYIPEEWIAYWKEDTDVPHDPENTDGYFRPEMKIIDRATPFLDPPRIHSGDRALLYFKTWGIYDAGLYQNVSGTQPGDRLRVSGWAHAWSANGTYDETDNPARCSEGEDVGCQAFYALEGADDLDDAERNITFRLGLDPTGGTDPWAETVIWGTGAHIYNVYAEVPPLEAEAESTSVTIFLRSDALWGFRNGDSYWDDIKLELLEPSWRLSSHKLEAARCPANASLQPRRSNLSIAALALKSHNTHTTPAHRARY